MRDGPRIVTVVLVPVHGNHYRHLNCEIITTLREALTGLCRFPHREIFKPDQISLMTPRPAAV